ncbi:hypothetical protein GCM10023143_19080 [Compostibacter hankyongensis]|uniref:Outer membrane protein beta-barrel domain-containing protein n=2 Tax=Compostibacter hankyongensis TaxID=1007089 RepID=A0ABP8FT86_9BACT
MTAPASTPPAAARGLQWGIRLNVNSAGSFGDAQSNFNPLMKGAPLDVYPGVFVRHPLSQKLDLQAGIALASPVDLQREKLVHTMMRPERAVSPQATYAQENITFDRLYYIDVPLTLQYRLSSRFSVGSGLQVSVLQKAIGEKQFQEYDRMDMMIARDPEVPEPENVTRSAATGESLNKLDLRWVLGAHYRLGVRWEISAQYQKGLSGIVKDNAFGQQYHVRNSFLQAGVGFRFGK